ncbi:Na+/H+ antiporter subunit E [Prosthecodimorpha staleyi]|uniref:Na+/H+ antiporter subunit E n=1 Tax=Prosthecodimorpha staleyi TaxID=2840188 RepID=A0A947D083_9HYPH|nr:Na+/H+ antiporter subunit E [Prosthecodimorpha staleyi]MBT9288540.1 Na+/H+ antiporter subunit E [Prosthecodimorpha staleyi]
MIARLIPHPLLSLAVACFWILLENRLTAGTVLLGVVLGLVLPPFTRSWWPDRPRLANLPGLAAYGLIVLWDILVSNVEVARLILTRPEGELKSRFVTVPLAVTAPEAIALLASTITMTPGTLSADLSADGRSLLVHVFHTDDPDATVAAIKTRYERRLLEIFP